MPSIATTPCVGCRGFHLDTPLRRYCLSRLAWAVTEQLLDQGAVAPVDIYSKTGVEWLVSHQLAAHVGRCAVLASSRKVAPPGVYVLLATSHKVAAMLVEHLS